MGCSRRLCELRHFFVCSLTKKKIQIDVLASTTRFWTLRQTNKTEKHTQADGREKPCLIRWAGTPHYYFIYEIHTFQLYGSLTGNVSTFMLVNALLPTNKYSRTLTKQKKA